MTGPRFVWEAAGRPEIRPGGTAGVCALCGLRDESTHEIDRTLGTNYVDRSHLVGGGSRVCGGCVWAVSGRGVSALRMWTVIATPGVPAPASHEKAPDLGPWVAAINRATPQPVADLLASPPESDWLLSVAVSGQKHTLPYARPNHGRGRWTVRMETINVTATPQEWTTVHSAVLGLRRLGVHPDLIPTRTPGFAVKSRDQLSQWRDLDARLAGWHTHPLVQLALWTITKETMK